MISREEELFQKDIMPLLEESIAFQKIEKIEEIIKKLKENTGMNKIIDPFEKTDGTLWHFVGINYLNNQFSTQALYVFKEYYSTILSLQEKNNRRTHKGAQLYFIALIYSLLRDFEKSRKYFLLDFVEDVITEYEDRKKEIKIIQDVYTTPCYNRILELNFYRDSELRQLYDFTIKYLQSNEIPFHPEEIILKWNIDQLRNKDFIATRGIEDVSFDINLRYYNKLLEQIEHDPSGKNFELLAIYLFSCIEQFEVLPQRGTESYHFDLLIRNLSTTHPSIKVFGEYIGVECKNIKKTVSVGQINHFIQKLRFHDLKCGIIFTIEGLSGQSFKKLKYAKAIQIKTFNRDNIVVFDLSKDDLRRIAKGYNLLSILLKKYEDIRFC